MNGVRVRDHELDWNVCENKTTPHTYRPGYSTDNITCSRLARPCFEWLELFRAFQWIKWFMCAPSFYPSIIPLLKDWLHGWRAELLAGWRHAPLPFSHLRPQEDGVFFRRSRTPPWTNGWSKTRQCWPRALLLIILQLKGCEENNPLLYVLLLEWPAEMRHTLLTHTLLGRLNKEMHSYYTSSSVNELVGAWRTSDTARTLHVEWTYGCQHEGLFKCSTLIVGMEWWTNERSTSAH